MTKLYKNSPISEAVCEFQFGQDSPWDFTVPEWYVFRGERTGILRFLEKYPFLVSLLVEVYPHIKEFFPHSLVYLTVATDPEEFGTDRLIAFIATDLEPDDALDALSAFDKKWWLNSLKRTQGKLCITLEFR